MSEQSMRITMKEHFSRAGAHWQRIEDSLSIGVPDINLCWRGVEVWIEAKHTELDKLPKRPETPVKMGLSPEQCLWLRDRKISGGRVLVVWRLGREWFVFNNDFELLRDGAPLGVLRKMAKTIIVGKFETGPVIHAAIT